jgi:hypothetical protein
MDEKVLGASNDRAKITMHREVRYIKQDDREYSVSCLYPNYTTVNPYHTKYNLHNM